MTKIKIGGRPREFYALVPARGLLIRVRYSAASRLPWRCDEHGRHAEPKCTHEYEAVKAAQDTWSTEMEVPNITHAPKCRQPSIRMSESMFDSFLVVWRCPECDAITTTKRATA